MTEDGHTVVPRFFDYFTVSTLKEPCTADDGHTVAREIKDGDEALAFFDRKIGAFCGADVV